MLADIYVAIYFLTNFWMIHQSISINLVVFSLIILNYFRQLNCNYNSIKFDVT